MGTSKRQPCPECGSTKPPIVYGLPGPGLLAEADRGEVVFGGCVLPMWPRCRRCGNALPASARR